MSHQVIIINSDLKMSKGKVARVSAYLTSQVIFNHKAAMDDVFKCIVLKTNDYEKIIDYLNNIGQDFRTHIDLGCTQVKPMTNCGLSFIYPSGTTYPMIERLKLY